MTVSSTTTSVSYTGNGSTTAFAVTFPFFGTASTSELLVVERVIATGVETTKTYTTHYTVAGGEGSTGTVTAASAPASTVEWHIRRNTTQTQGTDYVENDEFPANSHEDALDRLTLINQELQAELNRSFQYPVTYTGGASTNMPEPIASNFLMFNAAGDALTTSSTTAAQHLGGNGTVLLPYYSFSSDPNSGFYRIGADNVGLSLNGAKVVDYGTSGVSVTGTLTSSGAISGTTVTASGVLSVDSTTESSSTTTGSIHTDGGLGVAKKLYVGGASTFGDSLLSDTDSTDSLGSTGVRWLKLWVDSIQTTANTDIAGDLTVTGNLTVNGTTVTNDATNTVIKDPLIGLNEGATSNANDLGLVMERGSTGDNVFMGWDESGDYFAFGTTTDLSSSTGNITYSLGQARFEGLNLSGTSADLGTVTTVDVDGGTIDGTAIGGAATAAGAFTTVDGTLAHFTTSLQLATGATVTGILDEDAMGSDSATELATQQSIKAYSDSNALAPGMPMTGESDTDSADKGDGRIC